MDEWVPPPRSRGTGSKFRLTFSDAVLVLLKAINDLCVVSFVGHGEAAGGGRGDHSCKGYSQVSDIRHSLILKSNFLVLRLRVSPTRQQVYSEIPDWVVGGRAEVEEQRPPPPPPLPPRWPSRTTPR